MHPIVKQFRDFFVALKLTVVLLTLSIVLIFWATLAQVQLGIWGVQEKFFHAFFVLEKLPGTSIPVPVFPGGYFLGGLLLINLVAAHIYRFRLEWKKAGIQLTHLGLILLLLGELFTSLLQVESNMRLDEGETKHYTESYRTAELALLDTTNPDFNEVVAIPEAVLADGGSLQHPKLPFQIRLGEYYPNAGLQMLPPGAKTPVTAGVGQTVQLVPLPLTYKQDERNLPAAYVELVGPGGSLGTWLVSTLISSPQSPPFLRSTQTFTYQGHTWEIALRLKRYYHPFAVTLLKFTHDIYAGTDIPKNFSSRIHLRTDDARQDREVLIYMNNPLRHAGLTFYQAGFDNDDKTTILQVVRNPSWVLPYVSCIMMGLGLLIQFGFHLIGFIRRRSGTN